MESPSLLPGVVAAILVLLKQNKPGSIICELNSALSKLRLKKKYLIRCNRDVSYMKKLNLLILFVGLIVVVMFVFNSDPGQNADSHVASKSMVPEDSMPTELSTGAWPVSYTHLTRPTIYCV